jgi:hypothetical protein
VRSKPDELVDLTALQAVMVRGGRRDCGAIETFSQLKLSENQAKAISFVIGGPTHCM